MTHLECNPQMSGNISQQGGLQLHESEIQMGLPQSNLFPLSKSFQATAIADPRRVLPGLRGLGFLWGWTAEQPDGVFAVVTAEVVALLTAPR